VGRRILAARLRGGRSRERFSGGEPSTNADGRVSPPGISKTTTREFRRFAPGVGTGETRRCGAVADRSRFADVPGIGLSTSAVSERLWIPISTLPHGSLKLLTGAPLGSGDRVRECAFRGGKTLDRGTTADDGALDRDHRRNPILPRDNRTRLVRMARHRSTGTARPEPRRQPLHSTLSRAADRFR